VIHNDTRSAKYQIKEEITKFTVNYRDNITTHPNKLKSTLLEEEEEEEEPRRLKDSNLRI
jgi:hypothetical protein